MCFQASCPASHPCDVWTGSQCYPVQATEYRKEIDNILLGTIVKLGVLLSGVDLNDLVLDESLK